MPPALIALAPVIASGVQQIVKHKQAKSAEKKQAAYDAEVAKQEEQNRQTEFESQQNSPAALASRQKFTVQLGKLLGAAGGRDKLPPSLLNYYDQQRKSTAYTPGAAPIPKPTSGAGIWDVVGGAAEALSNYDSTKLGGGGAGQFATGQVGKLLASQNSQPQPLINQQQNPLLKPKNAAFSSGTQDFG